MTGIPGPWRAESLLPELVEALQRMLAFVHDTLEAPLGCVSEEAASARRILSAAGYHSPGPTEPIVDEQAMEWARLVNAFEPLVRERIVSVEWRSAGTMLYRVHSDHEITAERIGAWLRSLKGFNDEADSFVIHEKFPDDVVDLDRPQ